MSTDAESNKYVIYFGGGTMRGVYGAGVGTAFQSADFYHNIDSIYAASAGVFTGAYFLSHQMELGSTIYWEDLPNGFISRKYFWFGIWQRFQNRFIKHIPESKMRDPLNIDFLINIASKRKKLDTDTLISQDVPLYVKLMDFDTQSINYFDIRNKDVFSYMKAGISPVPYIHKPIEIEDKKYIDPAIVDIIGISTLKERHPNQKIIIVLNGQETGKFLHKLKNWVEYMVVSWMFRKESLSALFLDAEDRLHEDLKIIEEDPNVILISPSVGHSARSRTTRKKDLMEMYDLGIKDGREFLDSI